MLTWPRVSPLASCLVSKPLSLHLAVSNSLTDVTVTVTIRPGPNTMHIFPSCKMTQNEGKLAVICGRLVHVLEPAARKVGRDMVGKNDRSWWGETRWCRPPIPRWVHSWLPVAEGLAWVPLRFGPGFSTVLQSCKWHSRVLYVQYLLPRCFLQTVECISAWRWDTSLRMAAEGRGFGISWPRFCHQVVILVEYY